MIVASVDRDPTRLVARFLGGIAVQAPLEYGDFVFYGAGEGGTPISICIERKRIRDLLNSLIYTKRLVVQFARAREVHNVFYLIIEGRYKLGDDGLLELPSGRDWKPVHPTVEYSRLNQALSSLESAGVKIRWTDNPRSTAQWVRDLYFWWQDPPEDHSTLKSFYDCPSPVPLMGKHSLLRRVSKELEGVGWELSDRVDKHFGTVRNMCRATVKDWLEIKGIGKKMANTINQELGE